MDLSHPDVPDRVRAAVFWRLYERADISLIYRHMPSDLDVVDLGASLGVTGSHLLAQSPTRQLIAVEANPALMAALSTALAEERARIVHAAIDYGNSLSVPLQVSDSNLRSSVAREFAHDVVAVPSTTLTEILDTANVGQFGLVADIEGAEADLILQDGHALNRCQIIVMEMHPARYRGTTVGELEGQLEELGFEIIDRKRRTIVCVRHP